MNDHKNKHIREAVDYACPVAGGWCWLVGTRMFGVRLYCPAKRRGGHHIPVFCTPRVPEYHARFIRRKVDGCQHAKDKGETTP